jgi:hypothetical protein
VERLVLAQQIRAALTAHELWRSLLVQAALTGRGRMSATEARRDDACEFGRWLERLGELPEVPQVQPVRDLHRLFHQEAGAVLDLALAGRRGEAIRALGPGSRFDEASVSLTATLQAWAGAM